MTRRTAIIAAAVLLVLATAGAAGWRWWRAKPDNVLTASGTIEATEVHLSFKVSGQLIERPVDEGRRVERDTLVGRLESRDLEAEADRLHESLRSTETQLPLLRTAIIQQEQLTASRIDQARASLTAREEYLGQLKAGARRQEIAEAEALLRRANATRDNAESDYKRAVMLFEKQLVAQQQRDAAWTALEVATQDYQAARQRLDMIQEGPRREEIRRAEADVSQARASLIEAHAGELDIVSRKQQLVTLEANVRRDRAALGVAQAQLGYTVLRSPLAGVVLRKHVEPGEIIAAGTPVVTIADLANIWVKMYVPEPQLGRVKLGSPADVTTDSYRGKIYRGTVIFINSEAEFTPRNIQTREERVKLVFAVKIGLANPDGELKPGMPADVRIPASVSVALDIRGLSRRFGSVTAVDGLTLGIARGELFGLVGPDGAGKTTTLRMLAGILTPSAGDAIVAGRSLRKDAERVKGAIAYMSQRFGLYGDLTVLENLAFYADLFEVPRAERPARVRRLLEFSGLTAFGGRLADKLSGGMKQKLGLACALIHRPEIVLLDEPTNGVDPVSRRDFWRILYELLKQDVTILMSTAYLDEAERCSRVGLMHQGRLLAVDTPAGVKALMRRELVEIPVANAWRARQALARLPEAPEVTVFGQRLHVALADAARDLPAVLRQLEAAGLAPGEARPIVPSLEDVFVSVLAGVEAKKPIGVA